MTNRSADQFRSLLERGLTAQRAGRVADAEAAYRSILALDRRNADALHLLGILTTQRGDVQAGIDLIQRAVAASPKVLIFHNNLGNAFAVAKDFARAATAYRRAVQLAPNYAEGHANLGTALAELKDYAGAEAACRRALALTPGYVPALKTLATILAEHRRFDEAEACIRKILDASAADVPALVNLGKVLRAQGRFADAEPYFRRAIAIQANAATALIELGGVRVELGDFDDAREILERALQIEPENPVALSTLAQVKWLQADFAAAARLQDRAIALRPDDMLVWRQRLLTTVYDPALDSAARRATHCAFAQAMEQRVVKALPPPSIERDPARRLRVGWLSSDFRYGHPVSRNLGPLFEHRDRSRFEFICYTETIPAPNTRSWSPDSAEGWRQTAGLSDEQVARQIRGDGVDVMIYLAGRFDRNRPQVAAWRPAPIQVSFHDPATSGLAAMDYLIADRVLVPRHGEEWFSERVLALPSFYVHAPIDGQQIGPLPLARNGRVTFGSFNNPIKMNDEVLAAWGNVLRAVPTARLKLKYRNWFDGAALRDRVRRGLGDAADRLDLVGEETAPREHLNLYNEVDIALDPFPFTGSTTTFEALSMGVPVVTLGGTGMVGRWGASILRALKLDDLVAPTPADYIAIARGLAEDPKHLAALRASLPSRVASSRLCDGGRYARDFERLLRAMWRRWCLKEKQD